MFRLTCIREREQGAIAAIVAMLFGFGVLLSLAALTVDVGNINADRRQLQNGADAVALAVAQQCAKTGTCTPGDANLQTLVDMNAADGATSIRRVDGGVGTDLAGQRAICGNATGLTPCPTTWAAGISKLQECPSTPASGVNYVRVYAETANSDTPRKNILPYYFGAAITGISGANQQACATVSWGPPSGAAAPITLSYCEWAAATGNDPAHPVSGAGTYAANPTVGANPGYGSGQTAWPTPALQLPSLPQAGQEIIIGLQGTTTNSTCHTWNSHDAPGGFGYLATSTSCEAVAAVDGWMKVDTGNTLPGGCPSLLPYFHKVLYLPVFDCTVKVAGSVPIPTSPPSSGDTCTGGAGTNTYYHIMGYAKFYLSGYITGGTGSGTDKNNARTNYPATEPAVLSPKLPPYPDPCTGNDRCLSGWFLKGLVEAPPADTPPSGPPLGAYSIKLSG